MLEFTQHLTANLSSFIEIHGLIAVFLLMTAESALIPIPSEITMPFAGFASGRGLFSFWQVVVIGALGNLAGSIAAYLLGAAKGEPWIKASIKKWGRYLLIDVKDYKRGKKWFKKYGQTIAFTSRLLPVVRTYISLPAGVVRTNFFLFSVLTFLGSLIWSFFLAFLGLKLGENWTIIESYFRGVEFIIIGVLFSVFAFYIYKVQLKKK